MNALFIISGLGVFSLISEFANLKKWLSVVVITGLLIAIAQVALDWNTSNYYFHRMMVFDNLALAFNALILSISVFWFWMSTDYLEVHAHKTDRTSLVLFVVTGAVIMASFNNMAMLFLGIEILSLSLYALAGSKKDSISSTEAAFKYFLMGSFATGFLLFGITLVYGATGSFQIHTIAESLTHHGSDLPGFLYVGVFLILVGLAFKISAVPFHFWAPDVYEGSPTAVTALMSTVVKIAAIAAFYRLFSTCFASLQIKWSGVIYLMTLLTLIIPNVTAVFQSNAKRMLAYSSVGHVGYILLALLAGTSQSAGVILYYLAAYSLASLGAFTVLQIVESETGTTSIDSFRGLNKRNPLMVVAMTVALMSLAGIPPLAGFFGKYRVFALALEQGYTGLVILAIVASLIGVYYYFRLIIIQFFEKGDEKEIITSPGSRILMILLILAIIALGIAPDLINLY